MKVTIKDVAKEANVATSTVSRVLANSDKISDKTKARVNEAIKKLNYTPNIIARGLANNKTRILAVILPKEAENIFANPFFIQAMKGISICAQKEDYYIMYGFNQDNNKDNEMEWLKKFINSNLVDGICLLKVEEHDEIIEYLKEISFPFVVIGRPDNIENILWVDNDNVKAMYDLVNKLISYGHSKIGFIGAKSNLNVSRDRLKGYKKALQDNNIKIDDNLIFMAEDFDKVDGELATIEMLKERIPTAIVTTDDLLAFGAIEVINSKNIDISVAGFNNIQMSEYQKPSLASVDINAEKLGYYATNLLISKLEGKEINLNKYIIETKLVERESIKVIK